MMRSASPFRALRHRRGIALIAVLYFLVLCALTTSAVLFAERAQMRGSTDATQGARVLAVAEDALYAALATWDPSNRAGQPIGSSVQVPSPTNSGVSASTHVTRLTTELYSIVADARGNAGGPSRRVALLVRLPSVPVGIRAALISAVDVTLGPDVRILVDNTSCGDSTAPPVVLGRSVSLTADSLTPATAMPTIVHDSTADDSTTYLRFGGTWWSDLALAADVRLPNGARLTPSPSVVGGNCIASDTNWGDPLDSSSACANRWPLIVADGDLTILGGAGQGALLVSGHLVIAGPFTFSGQIVARGGIETRADNIAISGAMYAWRASDDSTAMHASSSQVVLTHRTTLRYSRCDAWHGVASWHKPRRVRDRAWAELF